jgi:hypothetical protein
MPPHELVALHVLDKPAMERLIQRVIGVGPVDDVRQCLLTHGCQVLPEREGIHVQRWYLRDDQLKKRSRCNDMKVRHLLVEEAERAESFGAGLNLVEEEERFPRDDGRGVVGCELLSEANGVGGVSKEQTDIRVLLSPRAPFGRSRASSPAVAGRCPSS